ncbi:hypothetical protein A2U01_0049708, partial [Trifolium medium]|nr:hypothetical protein [Trifolium medium]
SVKLEFPRFDDSHALEWIFRANQFFDYCDTPDPERLTIASVHFDQTVIPWYQMLHRAHPFLSWQALSRAIELEFGPSAFDRPRRLCSSSHKQGHWVIIIWSSRRWPTIPLVSLPMLCSIALSVVYIRIYNVR